MTEYMYVSLVLLYLGVLLVCLEHGGQGGEDVPGGTDGQRVRYRVVPHVPDRLQRVRQRVEGAVAGHLRRETEG